MRIFLTGFMASGKSFLGKELAQLYGLPFIDLDERIEQQSGLSIAEWFEQRGELAFREYESQQLRAATMFQDLVLACGGGTPCFHNNISWMNEQGITVFLDVPTELLFQRLRTAKINRPLVAQLADEDLKSWIAERLALRLPYYQQAAIIFGDNTIQAAAKLYEELRARAGS